MVEETSNNVSGGNSSSETAQNGQLSPQGSGDVNPIFFNIISDFSPSRIQCVVLHIAFIMESEKSFLKYHFFNPHNAMF